MKSFSTWKVKGLVLYFLVERMSLNWCLASVKSWVFCAADTSVGWCLGSWELPGLEHQMVFRWAVQFKFSTDLASTRDWPKAASAVRQATGAADRFNGSSAQSLASGATRHQLEPRALNYWAEITVKSRRAHWTTLIKAFQFANSNQEFNELFLRNWGF